MNYQQERDEFIATITAEGLPVYQARKVLAAANKLQRISELSCSSEAADRDRVKCPADPTRRFGKGPCICDQSHCSCGHSVNQHANSGNPCDDCDCQKFDGQHESIPRIDVQEYRTRERMKDLLASYKMEPDFQGDPRGAVFAIKVPSGKTNNWDRKRGICVPSKGFPASYWERH